MKFLFKYTFHLAILACVPALFSGCEQDPKYRVYDYPVPVVRVYIPQMDMSLRRLLLQELISVIVLKQ